MKEMKVWTESKIEYALRHISSGKLLRYSTESNEGGEFCGNFTITLHETDYGDYPIWTTDKAYIAAYVRQYSTPWYNSSLISPTHGFKASELEVIKRCISMTLTPIDIKVPTFMELMELKYAEKDPDHLKYLKEEVKKPYKHMADYSIYDLEESIIDGLWKPPQEKDDE